MDHGSRRAYKCREGWGGAARGGGGGGAEGVARPPPEDRLVWDGRAADREGGGGIARLGTGLGSKLGEEVPAVGFPVW